MAGTGECVGQVIEGGGVANFGLLQAVSQQTLLEDGLFSASVGEVAGSVGSAVMGSELFPHLCIIRFSK